MVRQWHGTHATYIEGVAPSLPFEEKKTVGFQLDCGFHWKDFSANSTTMPRELITLNVGQCGNQSTSPCTTSWPLTNVRLFIYSIAPHIPIIPTITKNLTVDFVNNDSQRCRLSSCALLHAAFAHADLYPRRLSFTSFCIASA